MEAEAVPMTLARVVPSPHARPDSGPPPLILVTENGAWPIGFALGQEDFQPGDLVEIRLIERCPEFGAAQWSAAARKG